MNDIQLKESLKGPSPGYIANFSHALEVVTCPIESVRLQEFFKFVHDNRRYLEVVRNNDLRRQASRPCHFPCVSFASQTPFLHSPILELEDHVTYIHQHVTCYDVCAWLTLLLSMEFMLHQSASMSSLPAALCVRRGGIEALFAAQHLHIQTHLGLYVTAPYILERGAC